MIASGKVRYQGEPIAAVVAEDRYTAHDVMNLIDVEYERLDAVVDPIDATDDLAPTLHEEAEDNVAVD